MSDPINYREHFEEIWDSAVQWARGEQREIAGSKYVPVGWEETYQWVMKLEAERDRLKADGAIAMANYEIAIREKQVILDRLVKRVEELEAMIYRHHNRGAMDRNAGDCVCRCEVCESVEQARGEK